jgi:hypothetical protein
MDEARAIVPATKYGRLLKEIAQQNNPSGRKKPRRLIKSL